MESKKRSKILVVDDDPNSLILISRILHQSEFEAITADNGVEALQILEREDISVVISDLRMPEMGGIELSQQINKLNRSIEVILMTAYGEVNSYLEAMDVGALDYLNKPLKREILLDIIQCALERRKNRTIPPDKNNSVLKEKNEAGYAAA